MQISANNIALAVLGSVALIAALFAPTPESVRPNVLVIMIDSLRADRMGAYGYNKPTTPFLDSLFKRGVMFENAYAPAYLTFQSDASLLSGVYPSQHNMKTWSTPIKESQLLLPEILSLYGYRTAGFVSPSLWEYFGLGRSFDEYSVHPNKANIEKSKHDVSEWIRGTKAPYFLFWHVYDLHLPFRPAEAPFYEQQYTGIFSEQARMVWEDQSLTRIGFREFDGSVSYREINNFDVEYLRASYDTSLRYVDDQLKTFFEGLRKEGLLEKTVVVISSEHGEDLEDHGYIFHRDLYDVNTHIPLAIIYPEKFAPSTVSTPVSLIDIAPTITSIVGAVPFEAGEGVNLAHAMDGAPLSRRELYMERAPFDEYAVIDWPWKYILRNPSKVVAGLGGGELNQFFLALRKNDMHTGDEFYNLVTDPGELDNLIGRDLTEEPALRAKVLHFKERMMSEAGKNSGVSEYIGETGLYTYP